MTYTLARRPQPVMHSVPSPKRELPQYATPEEAFAAMAEMAKVESRRCTGSASVQIKRVFFSDKTLDRAREASATFDGPFGIGDVAKILPLSLETVRRALAKLEQEGDLIGDLVTNDKGCRVKQYRVARRAKA